MGFRCGIVGLPNVGKSTLFNALVASGAAEVGNYPFCTVEPNVGRAPVTDAALGEVARLAGSRKVVPSVLDVVDIAGLVAGASKGEGLGNRFLGHVREADALLHLVRCFEDDQVAHGSGAVEPLRDIELIETELMLADLESLERQREGAVKRARGGDSEAKERLTAIEPALALLEMWTPRASVGSARPEGQERPRGAQPAQREAGALCQQRRRSERGDGQRDEPGRRRPCRRGRRRAGRDLGCDRGGDRAAR